jgi:peptidoglycan/xylan/chitin deacetylase (PgdA/CDA1 family)
VSRLPDRLAQGQERINLRLIQLLTSITSPLSTKRISMMARAFLLSRFFPCILIPMLLITTRAKEQKLERIMALTFDDSVASHATFVAPLLQKYGFGATFFITEGFKFVTDKTHYMTWEQIKALDAAGFEIGNHTRLHVPVTRQNPRQLTADIEYIEKQCERHGISRPTSFCYPAYQTSQAAVKLLRERNYQFARTGGARAFDPGKDDPLLMPQAFDGKPNSTLEQFKAAVAKARDGKIAVMTFHGVPDIKHPWVNTDPAKFESYMNHLKEEGCRVISLRDLNKHKTVIENAVRPSRLKPKKIQSK